MISLKQWDNEPSFRKELEDALKLPAVAAALEIVRTQGMVPLPVPAGVNLIHFAALTGARKEGYIEALINLRLLSQVPSARPLEKQPWDASKK